MDLLPKSKFISIIALTKKQMKSLPKIKNIKHILFK